MRSTWHPAPESLSSVLAGTWSVHAAPGSELSARVLPDGSSCLVFQSDGTTLRTRDENRRPWYRASVSGPRSASFRFDLSAGGRILIAQLCPAGAQRALGVPMSTLANRFEALDAVVGALCNQLHDAVQADDNDRAAVRAVEHWIAQRIALAHHDAQSADVVDVVAHEIKRSSGGVRVDDLAEYVNLSRRHLGRVMADRLGLSPKTYARIARFDQAVQSIRFQPRLNLAQIAAGTGYADQAHMSRDFAELGGIRPRDLRGPSAATIW